MYYRVAIQLKPSSTWQWKSTVLSSLGVLFQWLRLYPALQEHLYVFSFSSREGMDELLLRESKGLESNAVTATDFLQQRGISPRKLEGRMSEDREQGTREMAPIAVATNLSFHGNIKGVHALPERDRRSLEGRREEREYGVGGDHDSPYTFTLPAFIPEVLAWSSLLARVRSGEIEL